MNAIERLRVGNCLLDALIAREKGEKFSEYEIARLYAKLMFDKLNALSKKDAISLLAIIASVARGWAMSAMNDEIRLRKRRGANGSKS